MQHGHLKVWSVVAIGSAILIFLVQVIWLWGFSIDDAGVSWRYASHLAQGHVLRWNLDGPPVEGYSNFLWVLMLAGLGWLGLEIEFAAKLLGLVFGCGTLILLGLICRRIWGHTQSWWLPTVILALTPQWSMWAMSGLELSSVAALLLLAILSVCEPERINRGLLASALCGLVLSRPEGVGVALLLLATWVALPLPDAGWRQRMRMVAWPLLATVVTALALAGFRLWYFGYPLPNTVYAKFSLAMPSWPQVLSWLVFTAPFLLAWIAAVKTVVSAWTRRILTIAVIVVLGHTAMTLPVSTVMNFDHRYHIGFLALLLLSAPALVHLAGTWHNSVGGAVLAVLLFWPLQGFPGVTQRQQWESDRVESQRCIAAELRSLPKPPTVALQDAGRIPFWADLHYIDSWGLCDVEIARNKFSPEDMVKRRPNAFIISADSIAAGLAMPRLGFDKMLYSVLGFVDEYRLWRHCVLDKRDYTESYHYAILLDVFWAMRAGVKLPVAPGED